MQQKFYHKNFEKFQTVEDIKKHFVAVRMESSLFRQLKEESLQLGIDLSTLIRHKLNTK